jgi:hypothetical protein
MISDIALRILLWFLGQCIARGSRWMPSLRSQITRSLIVELAAGERVARHWVFDASLRRATTHAGPAGAPDCRVHFATSWQALRTLSSPRTVEKIVGGIQRGSVKLHGSAFVLLWYYGLTRKFVKIGRVYAGPRDRIPGAYLAHSDSACGAETIVIEPAVVRLDINWKAAWRARSTLPIIRGCTDEYLGEP